RDGFMAVNGNYGKNPNYPSTFRPLHFKKGASVSQQHEKWAGAVIAEQMPITDEDFVQATGLWNVLGKQPGQQDNLVYNVSTHLCNANDRVRAQTYQMFSRVDEKLGQRLQDATEKIVSQRKPRL
ncbi:peroxisomal catalase A, partial [Ascosphaera atra]